MKLVADSGSTKTDWCLVNNGKKYFFSTEGYNPYFTNEDYIKDSLKRNFPSEIYQDHVTEIDYYGAGCAGDKVAVVENAFKAVFKNARIIVEPDLLAAARALLGTKPGFAAILGTGTNTCLYNGKNISLNIDSLGYILGDEGSGASIGKRILSDYLRGKMPKETENAFVKTYHLSSDDIIHKIYSEPLANRFCAGFCKFLQNEEINHGYADAVVRRSFTDFFEQLVSCYPNYKNYSFNCIGSVGYSFKDILSEVATSFGMEVGRVIPSVIEGLVDYHLEVPAEAPVYK